MEWSEERAFGNPISMFVKCRGRRFSRDLAELPYLLQIYYGKEGLGKLFMLRSTGALLLKGARF